jgi:phosphoribosyl 1,2-cyclic phosphodiesterase
MIEVTILGSGSSGNATLVRSPRSSLLIDAGFSCRQLRLRLAECGWSVAKLDAILVTHEHTDHIAGLRVLCAGHRIPVFATEATHAGRELAAAGISCVESFRAGEEFKVGDMVIHPFSVPHDAVDPVGFVVSVNGIRYGHVTDIGSPTALVRHHLRGCHLLALETNHDPAMLIDGPYPWFLKQRIMSRLGHLSNPDASALLSEVSGPELQAVFLAHLSLENNTPDLALAACEEAVHKLDARGRMNLIISDQYTPTETITLE